MCAIGPSASSRCTDRDGGVRATRQETKAGFECRSTRRAFGGARWHSELRIPDKSQPVESEGFPFTSSFEPLVRISPSRRVDPLGRRTDAW